MLGLSLSKILFTIFLVIAVWRGFKLFEKFRGTLSDDESVVGRAASRMKKRRSASSRTTTTEMVRCSNCGTFLPQGDRCDCRDS